MKKVFGIWIFFAFIVVLGVNTGVTAPQQVQMNITMFQDVSSNGTSYGISFDLSNDALKNVSRILINGPRGGRITLTNPLNLNDLVLSTDNLSLNDLNRWFPEGDYQILLTPGIFGKLKVHMTHNFPSTPAILSPLDGSVNVPTNPVITWAPITGITGLQLRLTDNAGFVLNMNLPVNATSYSVPTNLLKPNTAYELTLVAQVTDLINGNNGLNTTMTISFTTVTQ